MSTHNAFIIDQYRNKESSYNLFDNVCGAAEVDEALVNAHLESVPGVGSLTTR